MLKSFCVAVATVAAVGLSAVSASAGDDPSQPVRSVTGEIRQISTLRAGADREDAMRRVLRDNFDMAYMARTALGAYWQRASEQLRARFVAALESSEARAYGERLASLAGFAVAVDKVTPRADGAWTVDSSANAGALPIKLAWEVRDGGQGPRIVDVKVAGISLRAIRQSEFSSYLRRSHGAIEPLVEALEARAGR